jgi:outer membrane protein assembly factor BamB
MQPRGDAGRRGWNRYEKVLTRQNVSSLVPGWSTPLPTTQTEPLVLGELLVLTEDSTPPNSDPTSDLVGRRTRTGAELWRVTLDGSGKQPLYVRGMIFTATDTEVVAVDAHVGKVLWRRHFDADTSVEGFFGDGDLLVLTTGQCCVEEAVLALDPRTGATRWFRGRSRATLVKAGTVYVVDDIGVRGHPSDVVALDAAGRVRWRVPVEGFDVEASVATATSDTAFLSFHWSAPGAGGGSRTELMAYSAASGSYRFTVGDFIGDFLGFRGSSGLAVDDRSIYLTKTSWEQGSIAEIRVEVLDRRNGRLVRGFPLPPYLGAPILANGVLYLAGEKLGTNFEFLERAAVAVDATSGQVLWQQAGVLPTIVVAGGRLFLTVGDPVRPVTPTSLMMYRLPGRS